MGGGLGRYLSASRLRQCGRRSEAVIRSVLSQFGTNQVKPRTFERETGPFLNFFMTRILFGAFIEVQRRQSQSLLFLDLIPRSQVFWFRVFERGGKERDLLCERCLRISLEPVSMRTRVHFNISCHSIYILFVSSFPKISSRINTSQKLSRCTKSPLTD
jgi:hypothetical protein